MFVPYSGRSLELINEQIEGMKSRIERDQHNLIQLEAKKKQGEWRPDR